MIPPTQPAPKVTSLVADHFDRPCLPSFGIVAGAKAKGLLLAIGLTLIPSLTLGAGAAGRYLDTQLKVVRSLESRIDQFADIADESASRLIAGGNIYLAGEPGMVSELLSRAGGLCGAKSLPLQNPLPPLNRNDVVLVSDYGLNGMLASALEKLRSSNALLIAFASADHPLMRKDAGPNFRRIAVDIPLDSCLARSAKGEPLLPAAAPAIAAAQWTYTAELLGACRRQGKQLAVYLSIFLDKDRARYARTKGLLFEPDLHPASVPRGEYARTFLREARTSLSAIRDQELERLSTAGKWLREATGDRKQLVRSLLGHLPPLEAGIRGDVGFFTHTILLQGEKGKEWIAQNLRAGDVTVFLAYRDDDEMTATANKLGARTISLTSTAPGAMQAKNPRHLYINQHWEVSDAVLELPGYDVKACPLSCIVGMACYYAMCGEAVDASAL
jgi:uncharacterized phosphosugar-binding protein